VTTELVCWCVNSRHHQTVLLLQQATMLLLMMMWLIYYHQLTTNRELQVQHMSLMVPSQLRFLPHTYVYCYSEYLHTLSVLIYMRYSVHEAFEIIHFVLQSYTAYFLINFIYCQPMLIVVVIVQPHGLMLEMLR